MKKALTTLLIGFVAMGVQADASQRQWVFDYTIDGPRQARPEVHGDKEELFIQFPKGIKPRKFYVRSCRNSKPHSVKAHKRGPYYVLTRQGKSLRVTTNKGSIRIKGESMCAKYHEKALALKLALEEKVRKAAEQQRKKVEAAARAATEKEAASPPVERSPAEYEAPVPAGSNLPDEMAPADLPTRITHRDSGNRGYNNFLSLTEGAPNKVEKAAEEPEQYIQQDYFKDAPAKQQTAEVFIHARNKPLKLVLARIYPKYEIEIRRKAIGIREVSITGNARPDFLYEELMAQMPDIKGWRYRKEHLLVIDYKKGAKR